MRRALLVIVPWLLLSQGAMAAQIVCLDMKPATAGEASLAASLTPILVAEVGRRDGMSVVSQDDVRALLELEQTKQAVGCDDVSCMADMAGSLGAELLLSSTVSQVGKSIVVTLSLLDVDKARVIKRSKGTARDKSGAQDAVTEAVLDVFRSGLPDELKGPASLSRRGFQAALAGLRKSILTPGSDPRSSRRRVVLDLVNTELDYDATPKLEMFDLEIRRGWGEAERLALGAKTKELFEHYLRGMETYSALRHDHGRVVEIRARARERGIVPSSRPLRFEDPEPYDRHSEQAFVRYWKAGLAARKVAEKALAAYDRGQRDRFLSFFVEDRRRTAENSYDSNKRYDERNQYSYRMLPQHAHTPQLRERCIDTLEKSDQTTVYVLRNRKGEPYEARSVRLKKVGKTWVIDSFI